MNGIRVSFFVSILPFLCDSLHGQSWKVYADSASGFRAEKNFNRALEYYDKAKNFLERDSAYSKSYGEVCVSIGEIYNSTGQSKKIVPFYQEARKTIEKKNGKENIAYAEVTDRLGQFTIGISQTDAEKYFLEALEIRERLFGKGSPEYARSCNSLGILYERAFDFEKAVNYHLEGKGIWEKKRPKEDVNYARSCNNLAAVYSKMSEYEKAEPLALEAKAIREITPGKWSRDYAITCMNLGNIYKGMGQLKKAEDFYLDGKNIRDSVFTKRNNEYLESAISLGNLYSINGEYEKAEPLYVEVRLVRSELDKGASSYALSCNNLGDLYSNIGQYARAEELLNEAKDIWNRILEKDNSLHAFNRNSLGQIYSAIVQSKIAESYFLEARPLWEKAFGKEHPYYVQNTNDLARVYWNLGQTAKADELYSQAFATQYDLINKIFQFTNENEKGLYIKNIIGSSDEYYSFYYKKFDRNKGAKPFTMSLQNRNLILSSVQEMKQSVFKTNDPAVIRTFNDWIVLKKELVRLHSRPNGVDQEQVKQTEARADAKEKELSRLSSSFAKLQKKTGWKDVKSQLRVNEAAIEFADFRLFNGRKRTDSIVYIAILIRRDLPDPVLIPLFEKKNLDHLLEQTHTDQTGINQLYSSPAVFNLVWRPIEKHLAGIRKIYFAPAGDLFKLSFGALPVNSKAVLGDKYKLDQLNSTVNVGKQNKSFITVSDKIQVYGGIEYDADTVVLKETISAHHTNNNLSRSLPADLTRGSSFKFLPGTMDEANAIKKQADQKSIRVSVLSGINASEESFDSLDGALSPSILHIATHGFFFGDPNEDKADTSLRKFQTSGKVFRQSEDPLLRSGLLFAGGNYAWRGRFINGIEDGIVTAYEVSNMYLPNTKMVVLSACETALGDVKGSEGVYGLQRAFKMAGVQNLVMSLWKVPDGETSEFMQQFYKNMFARQPITDAFYNAQRKIKIKYRKDPYKWAAWVLIR